MQDWIELKELVAAGSGLDRGTLRVIASVPLHVALALLSRRPITGGLPWLLLLFLALGNEAADAYADSRLEQWELDASLRDLLLTMILPTFLALVCRIRSLRPSLREPRRPITLAPLRAPRADPIVDAEFEEIG